MTDSQGVCMTCLLHSCATQPPHTVSHCAHSLPVLITALSTVLLCVLVRSLPQVLPTQMTLGCCECVRQKLCAKQYNSPQVYSAVT